VQPEREAEMAEVVRRELQFPSFGCALEAGRDEAGVVDQEMKRAAPRVDEVADGLPVREVESNHPRPDCAVRSRDLLGDRGGLMCRHGLRAKGAAPVILERPGRAYRKG
jgi:hypothetical protein